MTQTKSLEASEVPAPPAVTDYLQLASELIAAIDKVEATIPKLAASHTLSRDFVRTHVKNPEFLLSAIAAVEQRPELQALGKMDVIAARNALRYHEAYRPAEDRIEALLKVLRSSRTTLLALAGADAMQMYDVAKGLSRDVGGAGLIPHVENMRRDFRRKRKASVVVTLPGTPAAGGPKLLGT